MASSVVILLGLASSWRPLRAMAQVDEMNRWLKTQSQLAKGSRIESPSECLAILWGDPGCPIAEVPDALRMLGESVLYEFRSQRLDDLQQTKVDEKLANWGNDLSDLHPIGNRRR